VEKKILPEAVYAKVKPMLEARQAKLAKK